MTYIASINEYSHTHNGHQINLRLYIHKDKLLLIRIADNISTNRRILTNLSFMDICGPHFHTFTVNTDIRKII